MENIEMFTGSSPPAPPAPPAAPPAPPSWTECFSMKRIRSLVPVGSKTEILELVKLSGPVILAQFLAFSISLVSTIFCGHLGRHELAAVALSIAVINVTGISISAACGGIIRGAGKQRVGAVCYILGFYGIGFPIGVPLMFAAKMGIKGLWIGLFTCVSLQSAFLIGYLVRLDWNKATVEAQVRAGVRDSSTEMSSSDPDLDDSGTSPDQMDLRDLVHPREDPAVKTAPSHRTLVLRRGLALVLMLFILAVGIIIKLLVT